MRPTPAETITQIRRLLKDVIEPDLQSDYARSRLREIRAVLAQTDWDDAAAGLAATNTEIGGARHRVCRLGRGGPSTRAGRRALPAFDRGDPRPAVRRHRAVRGA